MSSPQRFEGFNPEPLFHFPVGHVIDAIPAGERHKYLLRGASVGALALNLAHGVNRVNPRDDLFMHVTLDAAPKGYDYARSHAEGIARGGGYPGHFDFAEIAELAAFTGRQGFHYTPGIVYGLPRDPALLVRHPITFYPVVGSEVPFNTLDPYSQTVLSTITGVDVANLPLTPGASRPIPEQQIAHF